MPKNPVLSIIVVGYNMARQLMNTLYSLSSTYQIDVDASQYEIIVVENASDNTVQGEDVAKLGNNFRYYLREEDGISPVPAINFGFSLCRGSIVGLIIDGARLVSPGVVKKALQAARLGNSVITVVPGYHLGSQQQQYNKSNKYDENEEQRLMSSIDWRTDGYQLFKVATFSGANSRGYMQPMMECNCLFAPFKSFERIGFADPQFTLRGGGSINLHIYRSLGMLSDSKLVVLPGEGSFHQYHGGVTTSEYDGLEDELLSHKRQLHSLWNNQFHALRRNPCLFGDIPFQAMKFLDLSVQFSERRINRLMKENKPCWPDDMAIQGSVRH